MNEIDVDGVKDPKRDITYIGKATKVDGKWICLANVEGTLCRVEITITPPPEDIRAAAFICSFCGSSGKERAIIIAGPDVNICDDCVQLASDCVDDAREQHRKNGTTVRNEVISFVGHTPTGSVCESCANCTRSQSPLAPVWMGTCTQGFVLQPFRFRKSCPAYQELTKFVPPGEFSGCRCAHCPEREGTGECSCCAERRAEEKNPGPDPIV